ncbi:peroxidase family protein [Streptomyces sp. NPDC008001]|uniref:peroxidase family protein n=1 Tax=Streptomyces sp. NPDC008001 TaxID=3364804 RepID=UPI0036EB3050
MTPVPRRREWHSLPFPLALLELRRQRQVLRAHNLYDTYGAGGERPRTPVAELLPHRSYDGSGYDPADTDMGRAGTRFDRNCALPETYPEPEDDGLLSPSPREVSRQLLRRRSGFRPATGLNLLAAAWIQFQNHGWFSHGDNRADRPFAVPPAADDDRPQCPVLVRRTRPDSVPHTDTTGPARPPTYENTVTHWWDGSQLYGSSEERCRALRTGERGKLALTDGRLPAETAPGLSGIDLTGFNDNYWAGLSLLHTLFAKEHNAICDRIAAARPTWGDERLFQTARLVNTAVMARIHTLEWTPALVAHPVTRAAMHMNWYGVLPARVRRRTGRFGKGETLFGIPGSPTDHHTAPYAMTEEFVAAYRMHPLIRDEYAISSHRTGALIERTDFDALQALATRPAVDKYGLSDLLYSFGVMNPGDITLHNHPDCLRDLVRISGEHVDVGAVDVLRDRERGVPRYTAFRAALHRPPVSGFEELTGGDVGLAAELREVYDGRLDRVDTMVGMYAERRPRGFAFSDTAFRLFVLMASRRLKSDRFFTRDFRPEVYTPEGMEWIERTGMTDVLMRHHPELARSLQGVRNAFAPWRMLRPGGIR